MKNVAISLAIAAALVVPVSALASPGGLNAEGCHTCHTNCQKYGLKDEEYHCHTIIKPEVQVSAASSTPKISVTTFWDRTVFIGMFLVPIVAAFAFFIGKSSVKPK